MKIVLILSPVASCIIRQNMLGMTECWDVWFYFLKSTDWTPLSNVKWILRKQSWKTLLFSHPDVEGQCWGMAFSRQDFCTQAWTSNTTRHRRLQSNQELKEASKGQCHAVTAIPAGPVSMSTAPRTPWSTNPPLRFMVAWGQLDPQQLAGMHAKHAACWQNSQWTREAVDVVPCCTYVCVPSYRQPRWENMGGERNPRLSLGLSSSWVSVQINYICDCRGLNLFLVMVMKHGCEARKILETKIFWAFT